MPEPSELPEWATSGTNRDKPDAGPIASGFLAGERPPAKWVNWLFGVLCDWVAWLKEVTDDHEERVEATEDGQLTAFGSFFVTTGTYANNDFYPLESEFRSYSPRNQTAIGSGGNNFGLRSTSESIGVWDIDLDLEFSTATAGTVSAVDLVQYVNTADTTGTIVATFHSNLSADPGGYTSIRGKYRFLVDAAPAAGNRFALQVNAGSSQQFNVAGRRKSIYVTQISRGAPHGAP